MRYIVPLTKSPHRAGRIGPERCQDWYRGVVRAKNLRAELAPARILILSAFQAAGSASEIELYLQALRALRINSSMLEVVREGTDTIGQIEYLTMLRAAGHEIHLISSWLHYPRVRWLCRGLGFTHYIAWGGIPRPREAIMEIILLVLFPIIDMLGLRGRFHAWVEARRKKGIF